MAHGTAVVTVDSEQLLVTQSPAAGDATEDERMAHAMDMAEDLAEAVLLAQECGLGTLEACPAVDGHLIYRGVGRR